MSKKLVIEKQIDLCNECPYYIEHVDSSVCEDSFDDPNYDWYCRHPKADNGGYRQSLWNDKRYGQFIGGSFSQFQRDCKIPEWCPLSTMEL